MNRLRGFLALVEARGGGEIAARELDEVLARDGAEARVALWALGIVREAAPTTTWPCGEAGCAREVKSAGAPRGGRVRLVAVCTRDEGGCEAVELAEEDVAQAAIEVGALRGAIRDALRLLPLGRMKRGRAADDVRPLGREGSGEERDVYFVQVARGGAVREVAAEHAGGGRRAWVLVLTRKGAKRIAEEIAASAVEGVVASGQVTVQALEDVVGVEDKRLVELAASARERAATALRLACTVSPLATSERGAAGAKGAAEDAAAEGPTRPGAGPRCAALEGFPPIERWGDVTLFDVGDASLVGVAVKGARRARRLSCVDLGLADRDRRPIQAFELLQMICTGNGIFGTRRFGTQSNGKRVLSELRTALRNAFGLEGDPFEKYSVRERSWKPRFRAMSGGPVNEA